MRNTCKALNSLKRKLFGAILLLVSMACLTGLNTALSFAQGGLAIHFLATERSYTATMDIKDKAANVFESVVNVSKKRNPNNLKIKKVDREKLEYEASKITESGEELMGSIKVSPLSETSCRLIFTATMGGGKPLQKKMKEFVQGTLLQFCDEKGLTCNIVQ